MKNLFAVLTLAALVALGGCKRGEEDPAVSFSSRDNRLAGEWTLSTATINQTQISNNRNPNSSSEGNTTLTTRDYVIADGQFTYTYEQTVNGTNPDERSETQDFALALTIEKDGSYISTFNGYIIRPNNAPAKVEYETDGLWYWKDQDKSKTGITLGDGGNPEGFELILGDFDIKKLSGSELILVRNTSYTNVEETSTVRTTTTRSESIEFVFTQE